MANNTPQPYLPRLSSDNRSRASSAASKYTPEGYPIAPPTQPNQEGYYPNAPTSQPSYPPGNDGMLMVPPSPSPYHPVGGGGGSGGGGGAPYRESSQTPNPPYPTTAEDPYMRPAAHARHGSHSSARSHRSRRSGDDHRFSDDNTYDGDRDYRPRHHRHSDSHRSHHSHHSHHSHSNRDDYDSGAAGGGGYDDDYERKDQGHPLRQAERVDSVNSAERGAAQRASTRRPTLGDTVVAMWGGLKSALGPRDK